MFWILGFILVPIAAVCGAYYMAPGRDGTGAPVAVFHFTWGFMFPWDNIEDGIANDTYVKFESMFMKIVYWSCIRNPANNLRVLPGTSCRIVPSEVRWVGGPHTDPMLYDMKPPKAEWFYAWQGPYASIWYQYNFRGQVYRIWLGFKIYPSDVNGVTPYRKNGAGMVTQWKRVRS